MELIATFVPGSAALCVLFGYLIGNFQTAIIISKLYFHDDVRNHGSGNAGSTNMVRVFGMKPGALTFAGDFLKGMCGVLVGNVFMGTLGGYLAALFVVIGHCWPVFAGFRGGKGVASSFGILWLAFPLGALMTTAVAACVFFATKRISVVSLSGILVFFLLTLLLRIGNVPLVILAGLLLVILYVRHIDNIRRILRGEEKQIIV